MKNLYYYTTLLGDITIAEQNDSITYVSFGKQDIDGYIQNETDIIKKAYTQLIEYFNGTRKNFDLPLNPSGTDFMKSVWKALKTIPFGQTRTYKQIAIQVGNSKASRAVGMANNKNPIGIIIPCHRVIGTNGNLIGYAGGLDIKTKLLDIEKNNV